MMISLTWEADGWLVNSPALPPGCLIADEPLIQAGRIFENKYPAVIQSDLEV
jgi:hypothetical protein